MKHFPANIKSRAYLLSKLAASKGLNGKWIKVASTDHIKGSSVTGYDWTLCKIRIHIKLQIQLQGHFSLTHPKFQIVSKKCHKLFFSDTLPLKHLPCPWWSYRRFSICLHRCFFLRLSFQTSGLRVKKLNHWRDRPAGEYYVQQRVI